MYLDNTTQTPIDMPIGAYMPTLLGVALYRAIPGRSPVDDSTRRAIPVHSPHRMRWSGTPLHPVRHNIITEIKILLQIAIEISIFIANIIKTIQ